VASIVAALESHHNIGPFWKPIDNFSFAFIAPLRADNCHIGHDMILLDMTTAPEHDRFGAVTGSYTKVGEAQPNFTRLSRYSQF